MIGRNATRTPSRVPPRGGRLRQEAPRATDPIQAIEGQVRAGKAVLVDVRPEADWAKGHLPGALTFRLRRSSSRGGEARRRLLKAGLRLRGRGADAQKAVALIRGRGADARPLKPTGSPTSPGPRIRPGPVSSPSAGEGNDGPLDVLHRGRRRVDPRLGGRGPPQEGYEVRAARNGAEALAAIDAKLPDPSS
jgi:rhodanese-related sulfurtransferase